MQKFNGNVWLARCPNCGELPTLYPYHVLTRQVGFKYKCCAIVARHFFNEDGPLEMEWNKAVARYIHERLGNERQRVARSIEGCTRQRNGNTGIHETRYKNVEGSQASNDS